VIRSRNILRILEEACAGFVLYVLVVLDLDRRVLAEWSAFDVRRISWLRGLHHCVRLVLSRLWGFTSCAALTSSLLMSLRVSISWGPDIVGMT
jgi:hypothetical protein